MARPKTDKWAFPYNISKNSIEINKKKIVALCIRSVDFVQTFVCSYIILHMGNARAHICGIYGNFPNLTGDSINVSNVHPQFAKREIECRKKSHTITTTTTSIFPTCSNLISLAKKFGFP